jgi:hypothetical protein
VPDSANAKANAMVASFMVNSFLLGQEDKPRKRRVMPC